jgi:hypothetical protein
VQTTQQSDFGAENKPMPRDAMNALIGINVIHSLGSPVDMLKVKVNPVGGDRYRVNVMVGKNAGSARVANSFFLTADDEGNIVASSPKIIRLY